LTSCDSHDGSKTEVFASAPMRAVPH
jgi:hypothetical protein